MVDSFVTLVIRILVYFSTKTISTTLKLHNCPCNPASPTFSPQHPSPFGTMYMYSAVKSVLLPSLTRKRQFAYFNYDLRKTSTGLPNGSGTTLFVWVDDGPYFSQLIFLIGVLSDDGVFYRRFFLFWD